jgi:hypothetical protein
MKKTRYSEEQIASDLRQAELGTPAWTTFSLAMWVPPPSSGARLPECCPASFALWKSFRNDPGQGSDHRRKVTGLKSESVTSFIPESRPASFRNADRDHPGTVTALPRNPQTAGST